MAGQGSLADFAEQLGGKMTIEGFDVILAQFGLTVSLTVLTLWQNKT